MSIYVLLFTLPLYEFSLADIEIDGFSTDLIPRDSLISPRTHNSSLSRWDRVNDAILRSKSHANRFTFGSFLAPSKGIMAADGDFNFETPTL